MTMSERDEMAKIIAKHCSEGGSGRLIGTLDAADALIAAGFTRASEIECSHPDRNGRHEWYVQADRSTLCRACGARIAAVPKPACSLHR